MGKKKKCKFYLIHSAGFENFLCYLWLAHPKILFFFFLLVYCSSLSHKIILILPFFVWWLFFSSLFNKGAPAAFAYCKGMFYSAYLLQFLDHCSQTRNKYDSQLFYTSMIFYIPSYDIHIYTPLSTVSQVENGF